MHIHDMGLTMQSTHQTYARIKKRRHMCLSRRILIKLKFPAATACAGAAAVSTLVIPLPAGLLAGLHDGFVLIARSPSSGSFFTSGML
jgi:hypothetical protein